MAHLDTPTRSRDDQSMDLPTLPTMNPHDSEGESMLSELSRSLHQPGNLSISQILSSAPGSYPSSAAATPVAAAPAKAATTPAQPDTPVSNNSFYSPSLSLRSISTPLTSTPHASFAGSRSRLSVLRSGGSGTYSTPRSDPDSTTSSRTRFALSGPWNQADESTEEQPAGDSFGTPAIQSRVSAGPDSFELAPENDDQEVAEDSFGPRSCTHEEQGGTMDVEAAADTSNVSNAPGDFQDVDLTSRSREEDASRSFNSNDEEPYVDMPSLEKSFDMPVNFGTPSAASRSRITAQELSLVQEEDEEGEEFAHEGSDKENSTDARALQEMPSPEMKSTFINLSRRRSNSRGLRSSTAGPLQLSPASTSTFSESSAATPNGESQASTRRDSFRVQDASVGSDEEPAPADLADMTTDSQDAPQQTFRDFSVPIPESNYGTPSPTSASAKGALSTPKPSSALELRRSVALAALNSGSRPKMRGTPHTRRSSSFAGIHQSSLHLSPSTQAQLSPAGAGRSQSYNESLISLNQLNIEEGNTSVLSVDSAEDLTNLHRANTSLPLSEATPRQGGIKIHKHLHNLNTQLHLRNTTLQDERDQLEAENEELRKQLKDVLAGEAHQDPATQADGDDAEILRLTVALQESEEELYALRQSLEADAVKRAEQDEEIRRLEGLDDELRVLREQVDLISQQHESQAQSVAGDRSHIQDEEAQKEIARLQAEIEDRTRALEASEDALAAVKVDLERRSQAQARKLQQLESDIEEILKTSQAETEAAVRNKNEELEEIATEKAALLVKLVDAEQAQGASDRLASLEEEVDAARQTIARQNELIERLGRSSAEAESPARIHDLEVELSAVKSEAASKDAAAQLQIADLMQQLAVKSSGLEDAQAAAAAKDESLQTLQADIAAREETVQALRTQEVERRDELEEARTQMLDLGDKLSSAVRLAESQSSKQALLEAAHADALTEAQAAYADRLQGLEEKLHEARMQSAQDGQELVSLKAQSNPAPANLTPRSRSRSPLALGTPAGELDPAIEDLHQQLHAANVEIGRLQVELASSPYKRAAIEARDLRIQVLESHTTNIDSQFTALRRQSRKLSLASHGSFDTTLPNQTIMSVRTPKSVGPMRKMPWLEQTPGNDSDAALLSEIDRLRQERDELDELVDDGFKRLKSAGSDQLVLSRQLADARDEVAALHEQLSKLRQTERTTSFEQARAERTKQSLQADVKDLREDVAELRLELSRERKESASLQDEVRLVTREFEACKRDLQDAEEHAERLQQLLDQNQAQVDGGSRRSSREMEELTRARTQLESQLARAEDDLEKINLHTKTLLADLEQLRSTNGTLRSEVTSQTLQIDQLRRAQADNVRIKADREDTLRVIAELQQDLQRTRREVKSLEEEIKASRKREEAALRKEGRRGDEENRRVLGELQIAQSSVETLKQKHKKETQGIFVEIKHLKAVILRESTFRADLSLQKEYLLILIGQLSRQQARVYAAIAQLGYPHPSVNPKPRSFKSVVLAVLMTIRTRNLARRWARERETKQALKAAYDRVRAGRLIAPDAVKGAALTRHAADKLDDERRHKPSATGVLR